MFFTICDKNVDCSQPLWLNLRYSYMGEVFNVNRKLDIEKFTLFYATYRTGDYAHYVAIVRNQGLPKQVADLLAHVFQYSVTYKDVIVHGNGACKTQYGHVAISTESATHAEELYQQIVEKELQVWVDQVLAE